MVRAASDGVDNRWQVPAALLVGQGRTISTLPEKPAGLAGLLKYTVQAPVLEGLRIGPVLGLSAGGKLAPLMKRTNERTRNLVVGVVCD